MMNVSLTNDQQEVFDLIASKLGRDNVFLVGGSVRDALLARESFDMDFAVRNAPGAVFEAFPYALYFERYGTVSFKLDPFRITVASFREERRYDDFRHPREVRFVPSLYRDYRRRDFTINCLYVDIGLNVIDPTGKGLKDLRSHRIRTVGNPYRRLREDPLRILRAVRFSLSLSFTLAPFLEKAIRRERDLLDHLNPAKVREEIRKCPPQWRERMVEMLSLEDFWKERRQDP